MGNPSSDGASGEGHSGNPGEKTSLRIYNQREFHMKNIFLIINLFISAAFALPAFALGPMYSSCDLVAGEGTAGWEDGPFYSALFNTPSGLAMDAGARLLYVADKENHCLRVIDLSGENKVTTLCGKPGKAGFADGRLSEALFNQPSQLALLPNRRLAVLDQGNFRVRLVDLGKKTVSTLAGGAAGENDGTGAKAQIGSVWSMVYLESQDVLYFTQPDSGTLRRLSLGTSEVSTLFKSDQRFPHPGALCSNDDKLYLCDKELALGYELAPSNILTKTANLMAGVKGDFDMVPFACNARTLCLAFSDGALYALQADAANPLSRLFPGARNLLFYNPWGEPLLPFVQQALFSEEAQGRSLSLTADPSAPRRFFLAHPALNAVTSLRDLDEAELMGKESLNSGGLMDFDYPPVKAPQVFRILIVGDSHLFHNDNGDGTGDDKRMSLLAKRMENNLNTLAAVDGGPERFEILTLAQLSWSPLNLWPYYLVLPIVKKYDVDMVLYFQEPLHVDLSYYFDRPLTADHIPAKEVDPEYLLKPAKEKQMDPVLKQLVDLCVAKKYGSMDPNGKIQIFDYHALIRDPQTHGKAVELYARPLKALRWKLSGMRTSSGTVPGWVTCLIPMVRLQPFKEERPFWLDVDAQIGAPVLDLSDLVTALRVSFYPLSELRDNDHYNTRGHELIAFLIARELIRNKWVPFQEGK
jgi:hypothetical protein